MPTLIKVWEVKGKKLVSVEDVSLADTHHETELEDWIASDPGILGENLLVISRQLDMSQVGRLDLLCMNSKGKLVLVELKRDLSPREAVAQALAGCGKTRWVVIPRSRRRRGITLFLGFLQKRDSSLRSE